MPRFFHIIAIGWLLASIWGVAMLASPPVAVALSVEEMLDDPALENRARELSKKLRCLVCQNQSIDDSDADLAKDLRREVRDQLLAGKSDDDILSFLRAKYGDYVLLAPPLASQTMALWLAPIGFIILGITITISMRRRRSPSAEAPMLSAADKARIDALTQHHKNLKKRDHND